MLKRHVLTNINNGSADRTTQVRVKRKRIVLGHNEGTIFWVTPAMARTLKDQDAVDIVGDRDNPFTLPNGGLTSLQATAAEMLATFQPGTAVPGVPPAVPPVPDAGGGSGGTETGKPPTVPSLEQMNGHTTDSASSNADGSGTQSSASEAGQALPKTNADTSNAPAPKTDAELSQSTTRTSEPPLQTSATSPTPDGGNGTGTNKPSGNSRGRGAR